MKLQPPPRKEKVGDGEDVNELLKGEEMGGQKAGLATDETGLCYQTTPDCNSTSQSGNNLIR